MGATAYQPTRFVGADVSRHGHRPEHSTTQLERAGHPSIRRQGAGLRRRAGVLEVQRRAGALAGVGLQLSARELAPHRPVIAHGRVGEHAIHVVLAGELARGRRGDDDSIVGARARGRDVRVAVVLYDPDVIRAAQLERIEARLARRSRSLR